MTDQEILKELRDHLMRSTDWADPADGSLADEDWCCIKSTLDAVEEGNVGLALTRWDDLYSPKKPELSPDAQNWRAHSR